MKEEFLHGGKDGVSVGRCPVAQTLDIGGNNGVAIRFGVGGHVEASAHLGAPADDGALAAVAVEGGAIPVRVTRRLRLRCSISLR